MTKKQRNTSLLVLLFVLLIWYSRKNKSKVAKQNQGRVWGWSCSKIYKINLQGASEISGTQCSPCIYNPLTHELTPNQAVKDNIIQSYNDGEISGYYLSDECKPLYECEEECNIEHQNQNTIHNSGMYVYDLPN